MARAKTPIDDNCVTVENADGIFRKTMANLSKLPPKDRSAFLDATLEKQANSLDATLAKMDRDAITVLKKSANTEVRSYATKTLAFLGLLHQAMADGDQATRKAVHTALWVATYYERMIVEHFNKQVVHSHQVRRGAKNATKKKEEDAQEGYACINVAVDVLLKKRGRHKQPSLTAIRHQVAEDLMVSYAKVLDAQTGGRKKNSSCRP